jgi:tRNA (cmo5U34)-methyltransferase
MNDLVKKLFDQAAERYDKQRRQLIPCFDDFYGTAVSLVRTEHPSPSILDLGAGTGLLTAVLAAKLPRARFTLIDFSGSMLEQARQRFAGTKGEFRFVQADYAGEPFGEKYDFIVSSLSIHHLPHPEKRSLFRKIFEHLNDGGAFVNADQAAGETPYYDAYFRERWDESVEASGLGAEAIEASRERRKQDLNAKVGDQLRWLREAGFADADCVYRFYEFAVFHAIQRPQA